MSKKRLSREDRLYNSYKKKYRERRKKMLERGLEMNDKILTKNEYLIARKELIEDMQSHGETVANVNRTIIDEQQWRVDNPTAKRWLATARRLGLDWDDKKLYEIKRGDIDLSAINDKLKEQGMSSGKQRAKYISYEIFGSE